MPTPLEAQDIWRGIWLSPVVVAGGGIDDGESAGRALRRELDEEAGAVIGDSEFRGYQRVHDPIEGRR